MRWLRAVLALGILAVCPVYGQQSNVPSSQPVQPAGGVDLKTWDPVSSISVALVNGVIEAVKGRQRVRLRIRWDLFPAPKDPLEPLTWDDDRRPELITVRDDPRHPPAEEEVLGSRLPEDKAKLLADDGISADPTRTRPTALDWAFSTAAVPARPSYLYQAAIERNWVAWLLSETRGADCRLEVKKKDNSPLFARTIPFDWGIQQYRRALAYDVETAGGTVTEMEVCRYRVAALLPDQTIYFAADSTEDVDIHVSFVWRTVRRLLIETRPFGVVAKVESVTPESAIDPKMAEKLKPKEAPDNAFTALIDYGAGAQPAALVAKGLLKAFPNAGVTSGALITDQSVDAVVGLGMPVKGTPSAKVEGGVLLGVVPERDSALYVGPYWRMDALALGGGITLSDEKPVAGGDSFLQGRLAGLLAVDLGRAFGEAKALNLKADTSKAGGWTLSEEMWSREIGLVQFRQEAPCQELRVRLRTPGGREIALGGDRLFWEAREHELEIAERGKVREGVVWALLEALPDDQLYAIEVLPSGGHNWVRATTREAPTSLKVGKDSVLSVKLELAG